VLAELGSMISRSRAKLSNHALIGYPHPILHFANSVIANSVIAHRCDKKKSLRHGKTTPHGRNDTLKLFLFRLSRLCTSVMLPDSFSRIISALIKPSSGSLTCDSTLILKTRR